MPSFDIVSDVEMFEVKNAVENANRMINQRYDLKGTNSSVDIDNGKNTLIVSSESDFQVEQVLSILYQELTRRSIDIKSFEAQANQPNGKQVQKTLNIRQGIDKEMAKKIVKMIKDEKFKAQPAIQQEQIRVTSKKRDDLQQVIAFLRKSELDVPLQYKNFKD